MQNCEPQTQTSTLGVWASRFRREIANPKQKHLLFGLGFKVSAQNHEPQPPILEAQARNLEPKPQSLHAYLRSPEPQEEDDHEVNIFAGRMKWGIVGGGYGG